MCACRCVLVGVTVCMFIIVGQTAEPIGIKLGTQIHLFPDSVYSDVKVKVKEGQVQGQQKGAGF